MEAYTHNLKIILVDCSGNIISDNEFLDEIKNTLCQTNTTKVKWNGKNTDTTIKWHRKELNNIEKQFMGDLFSNSAYNFDSIILNHTSQIISKINNTSNYNIKFHIFRVIGDPTICRDSYGVI